MGASHNPMSGKFQPPKWCCTPKDAENHIRKLCWVASEGGPAQRVEHSIGSKAFYTLGRDETADVRLVSELASRLHAAILLDGEGRKFLVDLKSTHGTFLNGQRLTPHKPVKWSTGEHASFGSGPKAEVAELRGGGPGGEASTGSGIKRKREAGSDDGEASVQPGAKQSSEPVNAFDALYGDLPDPTAPDIVAPKIDPVRLEPLPVVADPTKIIFLDIDGCLRPVHGRKDFAKGVRTMLVEGVRVPLLGDGEAKAGLIGLDFWPQAMRALRHIVQKTGARLVLSSDWRKQEELMEGVNGQLQEHRIPKLYGATPDLDQAAAGVLKALHSSFSEKRCKEIRRWLKAHPKVERFLAIDDIDLSVASARDYSATSVLLDPNAEFVRCSPTVGLTMELAKLAVCYLNGLPVTSEMVEAAYSAPSPPQPEPHLLNATMGGPEATPGLMPGLT